MVQCITLKYTVVHWIVVVMHGAGAGAGAVEWSGIGAVEVPRVTGPAGGPG